MGIKLKTEYNNGIIAEYWRIEEIKYDFNDNIVKINLKNYLSKKDFDNDKSFVDSEKWETLKMDLEKIKENEKKQAFYVEIMNLKKWSESKEVLEDGQKITYKQGTALL